MTVVVGIQEPCLIIPTTTHLRSSLPPLQEKILELENVKQFVQGHVANPWSQGSETRGGPTPVTK